MGITKNHKGRYSDHIILTSVEEEMKYWEQWQVVKNHRKCIVFFAHKDIVRYIFAAKEKFQVENNSSEWKFPNWIEPFHDHSWHELYASNANFFDSLEDHDTIHCIRKKFEWTLTEITTTTRLHEKDLDDGVDSLIFTFNEMIRESEMIEKGMRQQNWKTPKQRLCASPLLHQYFATIPYSRLWKSKWNTGKNGKS